MDIREDMVARARERAQREPSGNSVEFKVMDALDLHFEDGTFDAVISESVALFVNDKPKAMNEYVRVTESGGYVGLNEVIWYKTPVPPEVAEYMKRCIELSGDLPTSDVWEGLMMDAGLHDVVTRTHRQAGFKELSRLGSYSAGDAARAWYRMLTLAVRRPDVRTWVKSRAHAPLRIAKYRGYGMYVGRKQE